MRRAKTTTIEAAMRVIAGDLEHNKDLAAGACLEAADRLAEMRELLSEAASWVGGLPDDLVKRMRRAAK
jgi:hypothetical protein